MEKDRCRVYIYIYVYVCVCERRYIYSKCDQVFFLICIRVRPRSAFQYVGVELKQAHSGNEAGRKQTDRQNWSRQKCSHADMFAKELQTRMPTCVPTRTDPVPAIVLPIF